MTTKMLKNANHPVKGSQIMVEPIRDKAAIKRIKKILGDSPRNLCLFTLGINTAFRANELLSIRVAQVRHLEKGDSINVKMSKTGTYRRVSLNGAAINAIQHLLASDHFSDDDVLFRSTRTQRPIGVDTFSTYVKNWCRYAGLKGNYASHSLRKTWGYWQRVGNHTPIPLLMVAFGHSTQQQTLAYLGIQDQEIQDVYLEMEL